MMILCKSRILSSKWISSRYIKHLKNTSSADDWSRYDFEYEDDEEEATGDVDIENKYYNAKQLKSTDPEEAIKEFLGVPSLEPEKGDW